MSTMQMTPQNFSIPAGYDEVITFDISSTVTTTLDGALIWWRVYEQQFGIPNFGFSGLGSPPSPAPLPIIEKSSPGDIVAIDSPLSFTVQLYTADTINLLRNYYHEVTIFDAMQEVIGVSFGIMTVTATENRR